ncbi:hematopoietically-expressed homeobox protein hhex isoform X2 [Periplaneta americana]|uniref:hematopoietically-expressed homeobox protein hhex isoform X2 n=1 Tax=Periplaneta americana TaxID=6978 RepID=UPI0037E755B0
MCCRPKTSFLIEDILQHTPSKPTENLDTTWPARPTPLYVNQVSHIRHTSDIVRVPTLATASRGVYVGDDLGPDERLRMHEYSHHQRHSHPLIDPLISGAPYRGGFSRCWTVLPSYSLTVLARQHGHNKRKGGQVRFSAEQTATLERRFGQHKYLSPEERRHLAAQLKLSDRQSTSTTDGSQSDDTTSSNTIIDEDVFDSPALSPINIMS